MAQQVINTGTFPNDATGDPAQTAFQKCNLNFGQLFGTTAGLTFGPPPFPPGGTAVTINAATNSPALVVNGAAGSETTLQVNNTLGGGGIQILGSTGNNALMEFAANGNIVGINSLAVGQGFGGGNTSSILARGSQQLNIGVDAGAQINISSAGNVTITGGTVLGAASGGEQGAGTLNAQGLFIDGTPISATPTATSAYILALPAASPSIVSSLRIISPAIVRNSSGNYTVTHNLGTTAYGVAATALQSSSVTSVSVFNPTSTEISFITLVAGSLSDSLGDLYLLFIF